MTTTEHLQRIKTKCQELLAIAEKRTPGNFSVTTTEHQQPGYPFAVIKYENAFAWNTVISAHVKTEMDAKFIAACAGHAEAGWLATIATIDKLTLIVKNPMFNNPICDNDGQGCLACEMVEELIDLIIAAWPEELP